MSIKVKRTKRPVTKYVSLLSGKTTKKIALDRVDIDIVIVKSVRTTDSPDLLLKSIVGGSIRKLGSTKRLAAIGADSITTSRKTITTTQSHRPECLTKVRVPKKPPHYRRFTVEQFIVELTRHRKLECMYESITNVVLSLGALGIIVLAICSTLAMVERGRFSTTRVDLSGRHDLVPKFHLPDIICKQWHKNKCAYCEQRFLQNCSIIPCRVPQSNLSLHLNTHDFYTLKFKAAFHNHQLTGPSAAKSINYRRVLCQTVQQTMGVCKSGQCLPFGPVQPDFLSRALSRSAHRIRMHKSSRLVPISLDCVNATSQDKNTIKTVMRKSEMLMMFLLDSSLNSRLSTSSMTILAPRSPNTKPITDEDVCTTRRIPTCYHSSAAVDQNTDFAPCCHENHMKGRCFIDRCVPFLKFNETVAERHQI